MTAYNQRVLADHKYSENLKALESIVSSLDNRRGIRLKAEDFMVSFMENLPFPTWIKSADGTMMFVNDSYQEIYGIKSSDYVGKKDIEVWPEAVAEVFRQNDEKVLEGKRVQYAVEIVPHLIKKDKYNYITIAKFPIYEGPDLIAIGGIVNSVFP